MRPASRHYANADEPVFLTPPTFDRTEQRDRAEHRSDSAGAERIMLAVVIGGDLAYAIAGVVREHPLRLPAARERDEPRPQRPAATILLALAGSRFHATMWSTAGSARPKPPRSITARACRRRCGPRTRIARRAPMVGGWPLRRGIPPRQVAEERQLLQRLRNRARGRHPASRHQLAVCHLDVRVVAARPPARLDDERLPDAARALVLDEPTDKPRRLFATDRHFDWITWSPDGRRLLLAETLPILWLTTSPVERGSNIVPLRSKVRSGERTLAHASVSVCSLSGSGCRARRDLCPDLV